MTTPASFTTAFTDALRGQRVDVVGLHEHPVRLPMATWTKSADAADRAMLALCEGPTLDVGCGPGRMSAALAEAGTFVLGIDVVGEAVRQTRRRGAAAIVRDVFSVLPGEGHWHSALLADGNIGIGGDPVALLDRLARVVEPGGRLVVELGAPGLSARTVWARLVSAERHSKPFRWSVVGMDDIADVAGDAQLHVADTHRFGDRWCAVLEASA